MALNAMNEALYIARTLTMDYFFCPAVGMEVNSEQARTAALSVFAPLLDQVDTQMERRNVNLKYIGEVYIPDVPLFRENITHEDGLVGWLRTTRVRKEALWNEIYQKRREHAQDTWRSAMRFMAARIDKIVRLVIVMLHKNIRGFPETEWMRRYAAFGGGTLSIDKKIEGGDFVVEDMEDWYKVVGGLGPDVENIARKAGTEDVQYIYQTYTTITGPVDKRRVAGKFVDLLGAEIACSLGWMNNTEFREPMAQGSDGVDFTEETRWRYGSFPFKSNYYKEHKSALDAFMIRESEHVNITMLGSEVSQTYWNGYTLRFPGEMSWLTRLPNRKDWMDEEGNFKEGAFIEVAMLEWGDYDEIEDDLLKVRTAAEMASAEADPEEAIEAGEPDEFGRRLMQPGDPKGASPEVDIGVAAPDPWLSKTPAKVWQPRPGTFFEDPIFGRGRSLSFGRVVVIQAPAPAPGGGESMGIGPFTYTGKNSWVLMSLLILLLLFFLFR